MATKKNSSNYEWPLVGNEQVGEFLTRSLYQGQISGSYIFSGPADLGKTTAAKFFAKILLCENLAKPGGRWPCETCASCRKLTLNPVGEKEKIDLAGRHGDLSILKKDPEKKNISIAETREFIRKMQMGSFLGNYKVGIVKDADFLSHEAANALLKTLEEPNKKVVIILSVTDLDRILPTIISRSQVLNFYPVKAGTIHDFLVNHYNVNRSAAKNLSRLALGRPALAVKLLEDKEFYKEYLDIAGTLIKAAGANLNERLEMINGLIGKKLSGQAAVRAAERILDIWQGVARDMILAGLEQKDLIQHEVKEEELNSAGKHLSQKRLAEFLEGIKTGKEYLKANVSPKIVLEEIMINL